MVAAMTIGAALLFVVLLASTTRVLRWVVRNRQWRLAGFVLAGLAALIALHDATVAARSRSRIAGDIARGGPPPSWSAADIHAWLAQGAPWDGDDRWPVIRAAVAHAGDEAATDTGAGDRYGGLRQLCISNELAGILAVGISDARSSMLEDLVSRPCWAPGLLIVRRR
jgi:hypothetical protein